MEATTNTIDWVLCLAWSYGHTILTALVGHKAVNAAIRSSCPVPPAT